MTDEANDKDFDYAAFKKELVKELFWIYNDGKLDNYIRKQVRKFTRLAVRKGEIHGNVFDVTEIFQDIAWIRETAAKATPDGSLLEFTLEEINEYSRSRGEEPWTREKFFGLDKKQRPE